MFSVHTTTEKSAHAVKQADGVVNKRVIQVAHDQTI